jgi:hypothetical protein
MPPLSRIGFFCCDHPARTNRRFNLNLETLAVTFPSCAAWMISSNLRHCSMIKCSFPHPAGQAGQRAQSMKITFYQVDAGILSLRKGPSWIGSHPLPILGGPTTDKKRQRG